MSTIALTEASNAQRSAMVTAAIDGNAEGLAGAANNKAIADTKLSNYKTALGAAAG